MKKQQYLLCAKLNKQDSVLNLLGEMRYVTK